MLAAKYLQTRAEADDQVALAAFASDSTSTGAMSLLPTQPVTIYPVENPGFTSDGRAHFPTIDALASLEGGGSPLHAAVSGPTLPLASTTMAGWALDLPFSIRIP